MIARILIRSAAALMVVALLLTLVTATIVAAGSVLHYFVSSIPFEFACVVAGLALLIFVSFVLGFARLMVSVRTNELDDDEFDEEEPTEFAEQVAEIISEKLEPHFWKQHRAKSRRR